MATKTAKAPKVNEATRFEYAGETLEIPTGIGYDLHARYRAAALALHNAKEAAFAVEEEIKSLMGGFEHGLVDGEEKFTWIWCDLTTFDKKAATEEAPALMAKHTKTKKNGSRRFKAAGTVGVE